MMNLDDVRNLLAPVYSADRVSNFKRWHLHDRGYRKQPDIVVIMII